MQPLLLLLMFLAHLDFWEKYVLFRLHAWFIFILLGIKGGWTPFFNIIIQLGAHGHLTISESNLVQGMYPRKVVAFVHLHYAVAFLPKTNPWNRKTNMQKGIFHLIIIIMNLKSELKGKKKALKGTKKQRPKQGPTNNEKFKQSKCPT